MNRSGALGDRLTCPRRRRDAARTEQVPGADVGCFEVRRMQAARDRLAEPTAIALTELGQRVASPSAVELHTVLSRRS